MNNFEIGTHNFTELKTRKTIDKKFSLLIKILKNWNSLNKTRSAQETVDELIWHFDEDVWHKVRKNNVNLFPEPDEPIELLNDFLVWILESKLNKKKL